MRKLPLVLTAAAVSAAAAPALAADLSVSVELPRINSASYHRPYVAVWIERSEEHTSELQSREKLVCRLLLEKKKAVITSQPKLPEQTTVSLQPPPGGVS